MNKPQTVKRTVLFFKCYRCDYEWLPRKAGKVPLKCANQKCLSPYWDRPRKKKKK